MRIALITTNKTQLRVLPKIIKGMFGINGTPLVIDNFSNAYDIDSLMGYVLVIAGLNALTSNQIAEIAKHLPILEQISLRGRKIAFKYTPAQAYINNFLKDELIRLGYL